jgi:DNA-binding HxlR family transcriptional regulator
MMRRYDRYCPMAHALNLVGERWALLVVLELMHGPKRYSDLADNLPGIGTNVLASRLRDLEAHGIITRHTLPPPAASRVYDLTDYGRALRPALRELALWGARSLGPPTADDELFDGWLSNAVDCVLASIAPAGRFEFRAGGEVASLVDGEARPESIEHPDVLVEGTPEALYHMFVDRRLDLVDIQGDRSLLEQLIAVAPATLDEPVSA